MRIVLFGATGKTGRCLLDQSLAAGHDVTALVRHPESLPSAPRLRAVYTDLLADAGPLPRALAGADAVLSALGTRAGNSPTTIYSAGMAAILDAMHHAGLKRVVTVSAATLLPDDQRPRMERALLDPILNRFFGAGYDDMRRMERLLAASDSDWTVFRPPRLTDKPGTGRYRTAIDAPLPRTRTIPRADLATAMLAAVRDSAFVQHAITIAR